MLKPGPDKIYQGFIILDPSEHHLYCTSQDDTDHVILNASEESRIRILRIHYLYRLSLDDKIHVILSASEESRIRILLRHHLYCTSQDDK